jgi:hypothetical protein
MRKGLAWRRLPTVWRSGEGKASWRHRRSDEDNAGNQMPLAGRSGKGKAMRSGEGKTWRRLPTVWRSDEDKDS